MIASCLFVAAGAMAIVGALGAALVRNLFHASLLLGLSLLGTAGLYLFLEQHWLACVQVVVYVGGILVLILFATLFSADVLGAVQKRSAAALAAGGLAS
ncbi:MAG: NADH-quinone oxidoreductase subunit J, partial [Planctomycetes bacterium]|nr:NADH-quinone oxidoreductase subunit J [Planctomycetota bacterium]